MYAPLGEVPLILQGGGAYNAPPSGGAVVLPELTATAKSPYLLYVGLGLVAAYLVVSGKARGGKLW